MQSFRLAASSRRAACALGAAAALLVSGAAFAVAGGDGGPQHARTATKAEAVQALIVGESTGGGCRMGYDTQSSTLIPPDDSTADNVATCTGTGGMASPCTVGQQVFGPPGHTFMQNVQAGVQTHSVMMV